MSTWGKPEWNATDVLHRLREISSVRFRSYSRLETGWNVQAIGRVDVEVEGDSKVVWYESGSATTDRGDTLKFSNVFAWSIEGTRLALEHRRYGPRNPVRLLEWTSADGWTWESAEPHVCSADVYAGELEFSRDGIRMTWSIVGPRKNERIEYAYAPFGPNDAVNNSPKALRR